MGETKAQSEEISPGEVEAPFDDSFEFGEMGPELVTAGLTPMRSWRPDEYTIALKKAVACHDITNDIYVIAAIFHEHNPEEDSVYAIRVEGDGYEPGYGEIIDYQKIESASGSNQIFNIDCASSTGASVFVVFDKKYENSRWYKIVGTMKYGPYYVNKVNDWCPAGTNKTNSPRIAYSPSANKVAVLVHGVNYSVGGYACEICWQIFNQSTGAYESYGVAWEDDQQPYYWDIEWNGSHWMIAYKWSCEYTSCGMKYRDILADADGSYNDPGDEHLIEYWPEPFDFNVIPNGANLVFTSSPPRNPNNITVLQTDRKTYYINPGGTVNYQTDPYGGPFEKYPACEYWGSLVRIAHTYTSIIYAHPPIFYQRTRHIHWRYDPPGIMESSGFHDGYYPEACNAADTINDPEVLLVSSLAPSGDSYVYWNMEAQ